MLGSIIRQSAMVSLVIVGAVMAYRGFSNADLWLTVMGALCLAGGGSMALLEMRLGE